MRKIYQILSIVSVSALAVALPVEASAATGSALQSMATHLSFRTGSISWIILAIAGIRACVDYFLNGYDAKILIKFIAGCMCWGGVILFVQYCATKAG